MTRLLVAMLCLPAAYGFTATRSAATAAKGPPRAAASIGRAVEEFALRDYRGKEHALSDYGEATVVVLAFLGTECPLVKLYGRRLEDLSQKYRGRGVVFLGVNSNVHDSITEIAAYARLHGLTFPILKDAGNKLADRLGAERTPEVFVLDAERAVRYRGRIDDQYGVGYAREAAGRHELADAIEALLAGKQVVTPVTEADGCLIGRVRETQPGSDVTYSNQIARILQKRCVECHREGEVAPFALTDYNEVAGWAAMIEEAVSENRMPPWHANPAHGRFANERRLSEDERQLISRWAAAGAPQGDPQDLPAPIEYTSGWQLPREPDAIVAMRDRPFDVPAEGTVRYQYFRVDPGFTEDKWVKMAEVLPGNRAVVHHILVFARPPGNRDSDGAGDRAGDQAGDGAGGGEYLVGYVPGLRARPYPQGMAKLVPAGSKLVFQVHYMSVGSPQQDLSRLGLVFADPDEVDHVVVTTKASTGRRLRIPPRDGNFRTEAMTHAAPQDVRLLALMPHMHLRGKSFRYEARFPDGRREVLLDVPRYDFNWQTAYVLAEPKTLPAGTRVHCVAHFDNSEHNLNNPDPDAEVGWGDQSWHEMMIGYFDVAVPLRGEAKSAGRDSQPEAAGRANDPQAAGRAALALERFDQNKDGKLSRSEVPVRLRRLFQRLDTNGDGSLDADELGRELERLP